MANSPSAQPAPPAAGMRRLLGIDPGTQTLGWGIVASQGQRLQLVAAAEIRLTSKTPLAVRLAQLAEQLEQIVVRYQPHGAAVEAIFAGSNRRSPILLAHARGVALMILGKHAISVAEYAPCQVKLAVTGHGQANKQQVQQMVGMLLGSACQGSLDRSDALAVAICHGQHGGWAKGPLARLGGRAQQ